MQVSKVCKGVGFIAAGLLLAGCFNDVDGDNAEAVVFESPWSVSVEQDSEVPAGVIADLEEASPQFAHDDHSATVLPMGQVTEEGKLVTRFAVDADLPVNCLDVEGESFSSEAAGEGCFTFSVGASSGGTGSSSTDTVFLENHEGTSVFEVISPMDTEVASVMFTAGGTPESPTGINAVIDVVTGEVIAVGT